MIIAKILSNNIRHLIGHEPSIDEMKSAIQYLRDSFNDGWDLTVAELTLYEWRAECMHQCHGCGDWFLNLDVECHGNNFCCEKCAALWASMNIEPSASHRAYYED